MRASLQTLILYGAAALLFAGASPAIAEPPPWAPAHGYRAKQAYGGPVWNVARTRPAPFGISLGRCNKSELGSLLGAAAGGYAGSQIGDGDGQLIAIATGTLAGFLVGGALGERMDRADQQCAAQVLEHGPDGEPVYWRDRDSYYRVTPDRTYQAFDGRYCRDYTLAAEIGRADRIVHGTACRQRDGSWRIIN